MVVIVNTIINRPIPIKIELNVWLLTKFKISNAYKVDNKADKKTIKILEMENTSFDLYN